jgi:hypothetical protein
MFLRCTTASYHAGDFRKEKTKMEDEFGLAGKQGGLAKARSAVTHAASAAIRPAKAGALRVQEQRARRALPRRIESQSPPNKKPGARPGFGLKR